MEVLDLMSEYRIGQEPEPKECESILIFQSQWLHSEDLDFWGHQIKFIAGFHLANYPRLYISDMRMEGPSKWTK